MSINYAHLSLGMVMAMILCGAGSRSHDLWVDPLPRLACSPAHPEVDESRLVSAD